MSIVEGQTQLHRPLEYIEFSLTFLSLETLMPR